MEFSKNSAPVLIVMGQSNAHAHGTVLPDDEKILTPLGNVYGLSTEYNQAYGLSDVTWSNFVSYDMNLGETQNHTCCLANYFAKMWQAAIDSGKNLPDLYVIQISVGAQGISECDGHSRNMWYPMREPIIKPGSLGECDISLYPLATEILSLATMNLMTAGKKPQVIGLHFNQWETECHTGTRALNQAEDNYSNLFWGFFTALGSGKDGKNIPLRLYRPLSENFEPSRVQKMAEIFQSFSGSLSDCKIIDLTKTDLWNNTPRTHGIFKEDGIHYLPEVHFELAKYQWQELFEKND